MWKKQNGKIFIFILKLTKEHKPLKNVCLMMKVPTYFVIAQANRLFKACNALLVGIVLVKSPIIATPVY